MEPVCCKLQVVCRVTTDANTLHLALHSHPVPLGTTLAKHQEMGSVQSQGLRDLTELAAASCSFLFPGGLPIPQEMCTFKSALGRTTASKTLSSADPLKDLPL